jgi:hypothetical protein
MSPLLEIIVSDTLTPNPYGFLRAVPLRPMSRSAQQHAAANSPNWIRRKLSSVPPTSIPSDRTLT